MTRKPKPTAQAKQRHQDDTDGLALHLFLLTDDAAAGGTAQNEVRAKVTLGGQLKSQYWVDFTIDKGSAVFADSGTSETSGQTGSMGRVDKFFTDKVAEGGTLTAKLRNHPDVQSIPLELPFSFSSDYSSAMIVSVAPGGSHPGPPYYPADTGFPTTGFADAWFQLQPTGDGDDNGTFNWQCSDPCADVDGAGNVHLKTKPNGPFTVTAQPKSDQNAKPFTYTVNMKGWYLGTLYFLENNSEISQGTYQDLLNLAEKLGARVPNPFEFGGISQDDLNFLLASGGAAFCDVGDTVGSFLGEWRDTDSFDLEFALGEEGYMMTSYLFQKDGTTQGVLLSGYSGVSQNNQRCVGGTVDEVYSNQNLFCLVYDVGSGS